VRRLPLLVIVGFGLVAPAGARANDTALAEQLYEVGRKLMAEGHVAEACERFAESQRLDPATGTLLNLATCHETEGKLATAWAEFRAAQTTARHDNREDREQYAREHLAAIQPRLSYLTVVVPEASRAEGLEVMLDRTVIGPAVWGLSAPIDQGAHEIVARSPGRTPFFSRVIVTEAAKRLTVVVDWAQSGAEAAAAEPETNAPGVALTSPRAAEPTPDARGSSGTRIAGIVAGGVTLAALAVGTGFALRAQSKWDARNANGRCDHDACSPEGLTFAHEAETAARVADVAFVAGALGAIATGYLLFIRPEPTGAPTTTSQLRVAPGVTSGGTTLSLAGTW
jgi:hypothetical protein